MADDIAARLSMMSGPPGGKTIPGIFAVFGGAIQRPSLQANGLFTGQVGGPFGLKPKQGGFSAQMQYEQQVLARLKQDGDQVLAQAVAAVQLVQGSIHHIGGDIHQVSSGLGRAAASFASMVRGGD